MLNQNGSSVLLGNVLMIPVADAILYIQPLYVESSRNPFPVLQRVIAVYGNQPATIGNTLSAALTQLFAAPVQTSPTSGGGTSTTLSPQAEALLAQAQQAYQQAQADLKAGQPRRLPDRHQRPRGDPAGGAGADRWPRGQHDHDDHHQPGYERQQRLTVPGVDGRSGGEPGRWTGPHPGVVPFPSTRRGVEQSGSSSGS